MNQHKNRLLNLEEVDRYKNFLVFAKSAVEGYFVGKHKSPYFGSSAEFSEFKDYVRGDEISRIDWRLYAKSKKLYVKQYEEETDMAVYLMVDRSSSMKYSSDKNFTKFNYASRIAASLCYLIQNQGDQVGLCLFSEKVNNYLSPKGTRKQLYEIIGKLEKARPSQSTGLDKALQEAATLFKKRGRLIIISDFFCDVKNMFNILSQFQHRKYEILLMQVLDDEELNLPSVDIARFIDMETGEEIMVETDEIRKGYKENIQSHIRNIQVECMRRRIDHSVINTQNPYFEAIESYLGVKNK